MVAANAWSAGPAAAATPAAILAPGLVAEASTVPAGAQTTVPADGRVRGQDFTAEVSAVSWPQDVPAPSGVAYVAGSGRRLVAFTLSVAQPTDDSGLLNAPTGVTASLRVGAASASVSMTKINQQIAGGTSGSANTTGTDSFVASVPAGTHDVSLALSEAGFAQSLDLWTLKRFPPSPTVLYRDPSTSSVVGTPSAPFHLSFTNPADGFTSTDNAQVSSATLSYFAPGQSLQTPKSPDAAYLILGLQSSYPDLPYGQPNSGHFFSSFNPMAGTELTFTPSGGSPVDGLSNSSVFSSTNAANDDDGLFDAVYFFTVPATTTGGTLTVNTGQQVGDEFTGFTGTGNSTIVNLTASATATISFPAVPVAPPAQKRPPWVGAALPATGLAAASSAGSGSGAASSTGGGFPIWAAVLILVVVAAAAVVVHRWWHRRAAVAAASGGGGLAYKPIVGDSSPTDESTDVSLASVAPPTPAVALADVDPKGAELAANSMGRIEVVGVDGIDRVLEALLFFLVYHDGHHMSAEQILLAMRPNAGADGDLSRKTMHNNLSKLRRLIGSEHLPDAITAGGYLVAGVGSDWATFRRLTRRADTIGGEQAVRLRTEALGLVRGQPFDSASGDLFEWVDEEHLRTAIASAIATCALRLGDDHIAAEAFDAAEAAARSGLVGAKDDYGLWDLGARAIDARGDRTALKRWMADAARHLDAADIARIAAGLVHFQPSET